MTRTRVDSRLGGWVAVLACLWATLGPASGVRAQSLDRAVIAADSALTTGQTRDIEAFIDARLAAMTQDQAEAGQVSAARDALLDPLTSVQAGQVFLLNYPRMVAERVTAAFGSGSRIGRINMAVLAGRLPTAAAADVVLVGLEDAEPAVRFAAGNALVQLLREQVELGDRRPALVERLRAVAPSDPSAFAAGKAIDSLRALAGDDPGAMLEVLNARVPVHAADPRLGYLPENTVVQDLFIRLLDTQDRTQQLEFARAAARYLALVTRQLAAGGLSEDAVTTRTNFGTLLNNVLERLGGQLGVPRADLPDDATGRLGAGDFAAAQAIADAWLAALEQHTALDAAALAIE